jgi:hypothetical protein
VRIIANRHNARAIQLEDAGEIEQAIAHYQKATRWDRRWSVPWYNLGLLFKRQANWPESLRHNRRAVELNPADEAAWWNLGIAATALGEWQTAREAWRACGMNVPDGDDPIVGNYGAVPVRLNPEGNAEVVWCTRIDPARAIIRNIPMPESGHRCGDLLLHDGAPNGTRVYNGVDVPVFDELALLQPSQLGTFVVRIDGLAAGDVHYLTDEAESAGLQAESWSETVRLLCRACSEGLFDQEHTHLDPDEEEEEETPTREVAFAAPSERAVQELIEAFTATTGHAPLRYSIRCAMPPLPVH